MNKCLQWLDARFPLISTWKRHATNYYVPKNLNIYYVFGVLALVLLVNQFLTGLWLAMFYTPTTTQAFDSVQTLMREVHYGWLFRYLHAAGASALFMVLYFHLFRGLLYGSYKNPRELVWVLGMILLVLLILEAFFGYLLPWGQLSYWGAQVVTDLLGVIPYVGDTLVTLVRGGFNVGPSTLQRFYAWHVIGIPLLIGFFVFLHVVALRQVGSNNPEGIEINKYLDAKGHPLDGIPFHPYYTLKDFFSMLVFLIGFFAVVFFIPDFGGYILEPDNFIEASPLVTPAFIAPPWYLTPFYSLLRAIPNKAIGVIAMGSAIFILFLLPWLDKSPVRSMRYKGRYSKYALWGLTLGFIGLTILGNMALTPMRQGLARLCTVIYFGYFLCMPIYTRYETHRVPPDRI